MLTHKNKTVTDRFYIIIIIITLGY